MIHGRAGEVEEPPYVRATENFIEVDQGHERPSAHSRTASMRQTSEATDKSIAT